MNPAKNRSKRSIIMLVSIKASIIVGGKRKYTPVRMSIGVSLPENQWADGRAAVKSDRKRGVEACPIAYEVNRVLDDARNRALRIAFVSEKEGVSHSVLKDRLLSDVELSQIIGKKRDSRCAIDWIDEHIESRRVAEPTKKQMRMTAEKMRRFDKVRGSVTTWMNIDYRYYDAFVSFLMQEGLSQNTVFDKHVKNLKTFLRAAEQMKIEVPSDYKLGLFKRKRTEVDSVYLTISELDKIAAIDYSDNDRLNNARNWFLIGCNTGLRVSDLMTLTEEDIDGNNIKKKTQKTGADVVIPMTKQLKELIKNGFPRPITGQRYNDYIKEICRDAGIDKWQKVTSHTARRSFATNMYQMGVPAANLMLITGHTTESSFYKYIRTGLGENADLMREKFPELFE